ncbi:hypothetical protein WA026_005282 [Henosepilachna vigintioctopunctata]|uniref:Uncharacterized protein n=1 Tax=Henosepilachna vigintioctopunctata TaxID=420089 RepID=A0AAW1UV43_9CUCU
MNNSLNHKIFQREINRLAKYISTEEINKEDRKEVVHEVYIIQQVGANQLQKIESIIEASFNFNAVKDMVEAKRRKDHMIDYDGKTVRCINTIKEIMGRYNIISFLYYVRITIQFDFV